MKKNYCMVIVVGLTFFTSSVLAQLPANPWQTSSSGVAHIKREVSAPARSVETIKYAPVNADKEAPVYKPAIEAVAQTAKTSPAVVEVPKVAKTTAYVTDNATNANGAKSQSWIGSGNYGKLNYTGAANTYGTAYGQEMIAPEVNAGNIKIMIQHLRSLGYKIPDSYDNKFQTFLQDYASELDVAYRGVGRQNNPIDSMFSGFLDVFEQGTGLDVENLLFNSIGLINRN